METLVNLATAETLQYEILAEIVYEYPRYTSSWEWGRTKPKHWECYVCRKALKEDLDASDVRSHLWWEHNISPVQSGYTWIGRPVRCIAPTGRKHMGTMTINEAMVTAKALRGRLAELSVLRQECAVSTRYYGDTEKLVTPLYDVKKVDKKCVEIENFLMAVDTQIKQSNAIVKITVEGDAQTLLTPLTD